jgi:hypothetical protein
MDMADDIEVAVEAHQRELIEPAAMLFAVQRVFGDKVAMIPRCKVGAGVTGAVRYALGEGRPGGRTQWNGRTAVMVDEAAMIDTMMMAVLTAYAQEAGAKLILVGDDRQLSSIDRGGMFGVLGQCGRLLEIPFRVFLHQRRREPA